MFSGSWTLIFIVNIMEVTTNLVFGKNEITIVQKFFIINFLISNLEEFSPSLANNLQKQVYIRLT